MEKCKAKSEFILKNPEHDRDHSDLIITRNSQDIFWYRRQDGRVQLMMEFENGSSKYTPETHFVYKQYIGSVSYEDFIDHFNQCE